MGIGIGISCFNSKDLPFSAPIALPFKCDNFSVVKQAVKCSFKVIVTAEELKPVVWLSIAGKDHTVRTFFFITSVDQVKKHAGGFTVKYTPSDFVYDQA